MISGAGHVRHGIGAVRPYLHGPAGLTAFLRGTFGAVELQIGDSVLAVEEGRCRPAFRRGPARSTSMSRTSTRRSPAPARPGAGGMTPPGKNPI